MQVAGAAPGEVLSVGDPVARRRVARLPTGRPESHTFRLSPDGTRAYSSNVASGSVSILDVVTESLVDVIEVADVPPHPQPIVVHPAGTHAYSACDAARQVVEVELVGGEVSRVFEAGTGADGLCWAPHPSPHPEP